MPSRRPKVELPPVRNANACTNLAAAIGHLTLCATHFGERGQLAHEDETDRILTAACQLFKAVSK